MTWKLVVTLIEYYSYAYNEASGGGNQVCATAKLLLVRSLEKQFSRVPFSYIHRVKPFFIYFFIGFVFPARCIV